MVLFADFLRPSLLQHFLSAKRREDSVLLPPPALTRAMSLGYRSALADLIFAHVLVAYGIHFQDKRLFERAPDYLTTITTLDPKFREPYRLADTLIALQPVTPPQSVYYAARKLQDRGLVAFPYDTELWLISGQFLAYLAAPQLPRAEAEEFRLEAARRLARSCELASSNENIPYHCITAASLFNDAGRVDAARSFLERVLAVTDDPEIEGIAGGYLGVMLGQAERDRAEQHTAWLRALWASDLTFISREMLLLLGPRFDPARCAGRSARSIDCATSFRAREEADDR
jgi:hypothetical protein